MSVPAVEARGTAQRWWRPSVAVLLTASALVACRTERTEYRTRPAFYAVASESPLPDELELADGTRIVYREDRPQGMDLADPDAEVFTIREEKDDGSVVLRCMLAEHVVANTMTCLRNEEYELMWEQLLARRTREAYEVQGQGVDEFVEFMSEERPSIMETLNRMGFGFFGPDVVLDRLPGGVVRARFGPRLSEQFEYKHVDMVMEPEGLKLLLIH